MIGPKPFSRQHIRWCCEHLAELETGKWPAEDSSYTALPGCKQGGGWAGFEGPAGLAAVVTQRLEKCGFDGMLTYLACAFSRQEETLAQMAGLTVDELQHRTNRVIGYCSGRKAKQETYQEWRVRGHAQRVEVVQV